MNTKIIKKALQDNLGRKIYDKLQSQDCYLMGGAVLSIIDNRPINDYDIFMGSAGIRQVSTYSLSRNIFNLLTFSDADCANTVSNSITASRNSFTIKAENLTIQVINKIHIRSTPIDTLNSFDFDICKVGYSFAKEEMIATDSFFEAKRTKTIGLNFTDKDKFSYSSFSRIFKYVSHGYTLSQTDRVNLFYKLSNNKMDSYKSMKDLYSIHVSENSVYENETKIALNKLYQKRKKKDKMLAAIKNDSSGDLII